MALHIGGVALAKALDVAIGLRSARENVDAVEFRWIGARPCGVAYTLTSDLSAGRVDDGKPGDSIAVRRGQ